MAATAALIARLRAGTASSPELEKALGLSQSSVGRQLRALIESGAVVRIGNARRARYGLRQTIEGAGASWPLRRVGRDGSVHELGQLHALAADELFFESSSAARSSGFVADGISAGLPYFLQDQRPAGFLGRAVPLRYPELALPQRVTDWTDEHYLRYLTAHGSDAVGDLILGDRAFDEYLALRRSRHVIPAADRAEEFPRLAERAMEGGLAGASAHGEHPKFAAVVQDGRRAFAVLVKFSPRGSADVARRWSDLLVAEHHAHELLRSAGVAAPQSRIFRFDERTFLEVERFDREGTDGRLGVTSLFSIDAYFHRKLDNWIAAAARLTRDGKIDAATFERIRFVATFGGLVANTDRHFGNLAFYDRYDGRFELAPIYDMLPMLFAPEHEQLVARTFQPPEPTADSLRAWPRARALAEQYWRVLTLDERISAEFRAIADACLAALAALPRTGVYAEAASSG